MDWSPQQDAALMGVASWLADACPERQVFRLFGYAGTGKTTLAKHFAEGLDGSVLFAAFTGKAAHVMRSRGCAGASTLHSLIYHAKDKSRRTLLELEQQYMELLHELRSEAAIDQSEDKVENSPSVVELRAKIAAERRGLSQPAFSINPESALKGAALVVVDECSMVDARLGEDLLSFGKPVLVLGDPAQLPPVYGGGFFTNLVGQPDFMLTEIHRQAADNPIIALATSIREGIRPTPGRYGDSEVVRREDIDQARMMGAGQILVGRNATRWSCNRRVRELLGLGGELPLPNDKVVCLRNNHELGLLNGSLWRVSACAKTDTDRLQLEVSPDDLDGRAPVVVEAHSQIFQQRSFELPWWERKQAEEFDYGYALTVHKAQGSQWSTVAVLDESAAFREHRARWLYTAVTRAASSLYLVEMG